jgi:hypothetical protein
MKRNSPFCLALAVLSSLIFFKLKRMLSSLKWLRKIPDEISQLNEKFSLKIVKVLRKMEVEA